MQRTVLMFAMCLGLMLAGTPSFATEVAVVDTAKVLAQSTPGKLAEKHLQSVQAVLQKGLDDLQQLYKGKEASPEAQAAIREGYLALEQQMNIERQAANNALSAALEQAVRQWRTANAKYDIVIGRQLLLDAATKVDVTDRVMTFMNKQNVSFSPLPTVTLNPPKAEAQQDKPAQKRR